jgi:hypothetical protein
VAHRSRPLLPALQESYLTCFGGSKDSQARAELFERCPLALPCQRAFFNALMHVPQVAHSLASERRCTVCS